MRPLVTKGAYLAVGLCLTLALESSLAHHSGSRYDSSRIISLEGTVNEFQWTNPHVIIWMDVYDEEEQASAVWAIELTSPGNLRRNGWSHRSLNKGDRVILEARPRRDGGPGGALSKVTIVDSGTVLHHFPPKQ